MERNDDLADLGVASDQTHGVGGPYIEDVLGKPAPGLSDDD